MMGEKQDYTTHTHTHNDAIRWRDNGLDVEQYVGSLWICARFIRLIEGKKVHWIKVIYIFI